MGILRLVVSLGGRDMKKNKDPKKWAHELHEKAVVALQIAVEKVIQRNIQTGQSLVVWKNGKVAYISASDLKKKKY